MISIANLLDPDQADKTSGLILSDLDLNCLIIHSDGIRKDSINLARVVKKYCVMVLFIFNSSENK